MAVIGYTNLIDLAGVTLNPSSQAGDFVVANLRNPIIQKVWRTTSNSLELDIDLITPRQLQILALIGTNLTSTDTVRWRGSNVAIGDVDIFDSGTINSNVADGYGLSLFWLTSQVSARYIRLNATLAGGSYIDIGRLFVGPVFNPTYNPTFGYNETWEDGTVEIIGQKSGIEFYDQGPRYRVIEFGFDSISAVEAATIKEMDRVCGISGQMLWAIDPSNVASWPREALFGRAETMTPLVAQYFNLSTKQYRLRQSM